jgi:ATP-dependent helicase HepA
MLVVDEAHHLKWSEISPSNEYQVVDELGRNSSGLLLLTATPEQLGAESHFARLRLLDPSRYQDLASYQGEAKNYRSLAGLLDRLSAQTELTGKDTALLDHLLAHDPQLERHLAELKAGRAEAKQAIVDNLLDLHGPGRVLFRNSRSALKGFPKRIVRLIKLEPDREAEHWMDVVSTEFAQDVGDLESPFAFDLSKDPRVLWLAELLHEMATQKVLLIVHSIEKAEAIDAALRQHLNLKTGIFHEGLTLVQRDRHAAWFAEPDGARLLICSEIGSEGRNFQFAHHLVLFDLPLDPELLEQRIGRLDRIGQSADVEIHVPYLSQSPQEVLARWYHEGLQAFEHHLEGGNELLRLFGQEVHDLGREFPAAERSKAEAELLNLLKRTASARRRIRRLLEQGRDRLLESNSFHPARAQAVIAQIQELEHQPDLENYVLEVFDHFGVRIEELAPHTWKFDPMGIITDSFPSMPAEGIIATCDRRRALSREDIAFLTWDHPMIAGAIDLLLGGETGTCSFAVLPATNERTMLLELVFVLEPTAAAHLHADRFLPPTPVRLVISHKLEDLTLVFSNATWESKLQKGVPYKLIENAEIARKTLPAMFEKATQLAEIKATALRQCAIQEMDHLLGHEEERLRSLSQVNDHVRPLEISLAQEQRKQLATCLQQSRLRLDSLRLIWKGPPAALK